MAEEEEKRACAERTGLSARLLLQLYDEGCRVLRPPVKRKTVGFTETAFPVTVPGMKTVTIFTDGSCLGNPGPGGWAAILRYKDRERELAGGFALTTNNRMEITAAIEALSVLTEACNVELFTDSQYLRHAVERKWIAAWERNGWKTAGKQPVKNQDLWVRLQSLLVRHAVRFSWVRGHAGHAENERCDELARMWAAKSDLPVDAGFAEK